MGTATTMKHSASRELYEYWNRVRGSDRAPHRSAIEPSDIRRILADTFILEVSDRERHVVRLAGTRVCSIFCRELKATNFFDLWAGEDRIAIETLAAAVAEDGAAAVVTIEGRTERGRELLSELLLLPLQHSGPGFDRILGSFSALDRPFWVGSEPIVMQRVTSLRLIWPNETPRFMRRRTDVQPVAPAPIAPVIAATNQAIPFPGKNTRRRGHLVVLDGGKQ